MSGAERMSSTGAAVTQEKTGTRGRAHGRRPRRAARTALDGGRHQRRVERAGDVELQRADAARSRASAAARRSRCGRRTARAGPGALSLATVTPWRARSPRRVVVPRRASAAEHRAVAGVADIRRPRSSDEPQRVGLGDRAGGGERGSARRASGPATASDAAAPRATPAGEARAEDRGLGEARVLVGARERVVADEVADELEQVGPVVERRRRACRASGSPGRGRGPRWA